MLFLQVILFIQPRRGCAEVKASFILLFDPLYVSIIW